MLIDNLYVDDFPEKNANKLQCIACGWIEIKPYSMYYNQGYTCPHCKICISWPSGDFRKEYIRIYEMMNSNKPVRTFYEKKKKKIKKDLDSGVLSSVTE